MAPNRKRVIEHMVCQAGLQIEDLSESRGHAKVVCLTPDGRRQPFIFAGTPSDVRGDRNKLACMRRFARGDMGKYA